MGSTAPSSIGGGKNSQNQFAWGSGSSINGWVDWALIKLGLQKPVPQGWYAGKLSTRSHGEMISADEY
jgi:hypothetical protein